MKSLFIEKEIKYIGSQLAPHWIYKNFHILGDAVVSFIGEMDVKITEMVDIEDVISIEELRKIVGDKFKIRRSGDDIFVNIDGVDKKLSVSIATQSITSCLIHTGLNIDPTGAPVDACGLTTDLGITDVETFAKNVMKRYIEEDTEISEATCKVRGV